MKTTNHTPAPWVSTGGGAIRANGLKLVARMRDSVGPRYLADARLIAAAPDMLEALEGMMTLYEELQPTGGYQSYADEARAAIAKAKGETP